MTSEHNAPAPHKEAHEHYTETTRRVQEGADTATRTVNTGVQSALAAVHKMLNAARR